MATNLIIKLASVWEQTTAAIEGTIVDEEGTPIPGTALVSLVFTLFRRNATNDIINGRDHVDILGTLGGEVNGGSVDENGVLRMRLEPADNVIGSGDENHGMTFKWTFFYLGHLETGAIEATLPVRNMTREPFP